MENYYTVTEYAALYNCDTGNVRRMLINGVIKGEKMGNQWIIPKTKKPLSPRSRSHSQKVAIIRQIMIGIRSSFITGRMAIMHCLMIPR